MLVSLIKKMYHVTLNLKVVFTIICRLIKDEKVLRLPMPSSCFLSIFVTPQQKKSYLKEEN